MIRVFFLGIEQHMEHNEDFEIAHLLENAHGVPFKVLDELSGNKFPYNQHIIQ
jgi:hypothetical protein